jgi:hypothetical protein
MPTAPERTRSSRHERRGVSPEPLSERSSCANPRGKALTFIGRARRKRGPGVPTVAGTRGREGLPAGSRLSLRMGSARELAVVRWRCPSILACRRSTRAPEPASCSWSGPGIVRGGAFRARRDSRHCAGRAARRPGGRAVHISRIGVPRAPRVRRARSTKSCGSGPERSGQRPCGGPITHVVGRLRSRPAGDVLLPGPDARIAPTTFDEWLAGEAISR